MTVKRGLGVTPRFEAVLPASGYWAIFMNGQEDQNSFHAMPVVCFHVSRLVDELDSHGHPVLHLSPLGENGCPLDALDDYRGIYASDTPPEYGSMEYARHDGSGERLSPNAYAPSFP